MACGVHLGIFLICLIQAEHVCCLWATQAKGSTSQNGKKDVGFLQQDEGLEQLGGSHPQDQLRHPSIRSGYSQTPSQPDQSGKPRVKSVQSSLLSRPNLGVITLKQVNVQNAPDEQSFVFSSSIASASSISKYDQKNSHTDAIKLGNWPTQQLAPRASKYQSPLGNSYSKLPSYQLAAGQKAPSAPAQYVTRSLSPPLNPSSMAAPPQELPAQRMTSASSRGRQMSSQRGSKPGLLNLSQTGARDQYQRKLYALLPGNAQESYQPYSQSGQVDTKFGAPASFQANRPEMPMSQRLSYSSTVQSPNGARSGGKFAPTKTFNIPNRYGGSTIKRLRDPVDQAQAVVSKPQPTYAAPQRQSMSYKSQVQNVAQEAYVAPTRPSLSYQVQNQASVWKPLPTYAAPTRESVPSEPRVPSIHQASLWKRFKFPSRFQ